MINPLTSISALVQLIQRKNKDENDVLKILNHVLEHQNPFDMATVPSNLINIVTGQVTSSEVQASLGSFLEAGSKKHQEFLV